MRALISAFVNFSFAIINTSKVPTLRMGYFVDEMNACKSLGEVVCGTWYTVVIMCRMRH